MYVRVQMIRWTCRHNVAMIPGHSMIVAGPIWCPGVWLQLCALGIKNACNSLERLTVTHLNWFATEHTATEKCRGLSD